MDHVLLFYMKTREDKKVGTSLDSKYNNQVHQCNSVTLYSIVEPAAWMFLALQ